VKKKLPSPQPMNTKTKPINLATPIGSPMKEPSKHSAEELVETLRFADYTSEEINQFFSSSKKDKTKAASPTPQPHIYTFASQTADSDPVEDPSTVKDDNLIDKLREDIMIAEVLESHIKKENSVLKDRVHTL